MTEYSEAFKANMVKKLMLPGGPTASALSIRSGICQPTLSRWLRDAKEESVSPRKPSARVPRRPGEWKPEEKLHLVAQAEGFRRHSREFLRREVFTRRTSPSGGVRPSSLSNARKDAGTSGRPSVRELERELLRKDKALAETAALLVLQKKVQHYWGDEDDSTKKGPTVIAALLAEAVDAGARRHRACQTIGLCARTLTRWCAREGKTGAPTRCRLRTLTVVRRPRSSRTPRRPSTASCRLVGRPLLADRRLRRVGVERLSRAARAWPDEPPRAARPRRIGGRPSTWRPAPMPAGLGTSPICVSDTWGLLLPVPGPRHLQPQGRRLRGPRRRVGGARLRPASPPASASRCARHARPARGQRRSHEGLEHARDSAAPRRHCVLQPAERERRQPLRRGDLPVHEVPPRLPQEALRGPRRATAWVEGFVRWYNGEHLHSGIRFVRPIDRHEGRDEAILAARLASTRRPGSTPRSGPEAPAIGRLRRRPPQSRRETTAICTDRSMDNSLDTHRRASGWGSALRASGWGARRFAPRAGGLGASRLGLGGSALRASGWGARRFAPRAGGLGASRLGLGGSALRASGWGARRFAPRAGGLGASRLGLGGSALRASGWGARRFAPRAGGLGASRLGLGGSALRASAGGLGASRLGLGGSALRASGWGARRFAPRAGGLGASRLGLGGSALRASGWGSALRASAGGSALRASAGGSALRASAGGSALRARGSGGLGGLRGLALGHRALVPGDESQEAYHHRDAQDEARQQGGPLRTSGAGGGTLVGRSRGLRFWTHHVLDLIFVERRHADAPHAAHAGERLGQLVRRLEAPVRDRASTRARTRRRTRGERRD